MSLPESLGAFLTQSRNLILAGNRAGGRPHLTPSWFYWDGERFYVSTTRDRVKHALFRRDPRAQLLIDDPAGPRAVLIPATVEIREDLAAELPRFRAIRDKYGMKTLDDDDHLGSLIAEGRVVPTSWDRVRTVLDNARRGRPAPAAPGNSVLKPAAQAPRVRR
jgi:PPOX class probable F420-dependent enzyme